MQTTLTWHPISVTPPDSEVDYLCVDESGVFWVCAWASHMHPDGFFDLGADMAPLNLIKWAALPHGEV